MNDIVIDLQKSGRLVGLDPKSRLRKSLYLFVFNRIPWLRLSPWQYDTILFHFLLSYLMLRKYMVQFPVHEIWEPSDLSLQPCITQLLST